MSGRAALCFTDSGAWAGYTGREAALPRFLPVGSGAAGSLSPLTFTDTPRVAAGGQLYPTTSALRSLLAGLVDQLDVPRPVGKLTCGYPAHWGSARRAVLRSAAREIARETHLVPTAVALAGQADALNPVLVVEQAELTSTVSVVDSAGEVAACELVMAGQADGEHGVPAILRAAQALASEHSPALVLVATSAESAPLTGAFRTAFPAIQIHAGDWSGAIQELLTEHPQQSADTPDVRAAEIPPWPAEPPVLKRPLAVGAAAGMAGMVLAGAVWWSQHQDDQPVSTQAAGSLKLTPGTPARTSAAAPVAGVVIGDVLMFPPAGWVRSDGAIDIGTWTKFTGPSDRQIMVKVNPLNVGMGYDAVADWLSVEMRKQPGKFRDLRRDAVLGGRRGIAYSEVLQAQREISWHVLVEHRTQISVGCAHPAGGWDTIATECSAFVRTIRLRP